MLSRPQISSSVPAALAQLNLKRTAVGSLPLALRMCSPGQSNALVRASSQSKNGSQWIWARAKTAMRIRYGEKAVMISPGVSRLTVAVGPGVGAQARLLLEAPLVDAALAAGHGRARAAAGTPTTSPGCQNCSSAMIAPAPASEATTSASSTER